MRTTTFDQGHELGHDVGHEIAEACRAADGPLEETRVEALFASDLQRSEATTPQTVRDAVTSTVSRLGTRGCAARVAQEFGEHPETAVGRMRWALVTIRQAYALR